MTDRRICSHSPDVDRKTVVAEGVRVGLGADAVLAADVVGLVLYEVDCRARS